MAKTKIGGITVEIGADTSDLSKKLKDVNSESKKTTAELKSIDAALKQAPNSVELWKQKQEALAKSVENSKKKLEALVSEQENLKKGLQDGTVTEEAYKAYQREIEITKGQIESAETFKPIGFVMAEIHDFPRLKQRFCRSFPRLCSAQ